VSDRTSLDIEPSSAPSPDGSYLVPVDWLADGQVLALPLLAG
jgi:hypothetical protein